MDRSGGAWWWTVAAAKRLSRPPSHGVGSEHHRQCLTAPERHLRAHGSDEELVSRSR